jgi:hypothetical protein
MYPSLPGVLTELYFNSNTCLNLQAILLHFTLLSLPQGSGPPMNA